MACRLIIGILMIAVEPAVIQPIDEVAGKTKEPMVPETSPDRRQHLKPGRGVGGKVVFPAGAG